jgi:hypothetical protein
MEEREEALVLGVVNDIRVELDLWWSELELERWD